MIVDSHTDSSEHLLGPAVRDCIILQNGHCNNELSYAEEYEMRYELQTGNHERECKGANGTHERYMY